MKTQFLKTALWAMAMLFIFGTAIAQPANDFCTTAITLQCGQSILGTTTGALPSAPNSAPDVWYRMDNLSGTVTASLCAGATFDTYLKVYRQTPGGSPCTSFNSVGENDNYCGLQSQVTWIANPTDEYFIVVTGSATPDFGDFTLTVKCTGTTAPGNDECADATLLACGAGAAGNTTYANPDLGLSAPGVWYRFIGTGTNATFSTCTSGFDTQLFVFEGPNCPTDILNAIADNDDYCGTSSQVTIPTTLGTTYYVLVTGYGNRFGSFQFSIECEETETPVNDLCANAIHMACGTSYIGSTENATSDFGYSIPSIGTPGVWFHVTGDGNPVTASLCSGLTDYDSYIWVFQGSCERLSFVARNNNYCGLQSQVTFATTLGTDYYILVGGFNNAQGNYQLNVYGTCPSMIAPGPGETRKTDATSTELDVEVFPNPSSNFVNINIDLPSTASVAIRITDLSGKEISKVDLGELKSGMHSFRHQWNEIPAGVYLYQVIAGENQFNGKLQVVH